MLRLTKFLAGSLAGLLIAACATHALRSPPAPKVMNLGPEFKSFWREARDQNFEVQLRLWNQIMEKPHQKFFDAIVWQNPENPNWEERKVRQLKRYFGLYPKYYPQIAANFERFNEVIGEHIAQFRKSFPDAVFDLTIYAAPTATFNGKGGEGGDGGDELGKTVLVFGIDVLTERQDNPDVLYSHELFHIYHAAKIGVDEKKFLNAGRLTLPLWLEGLATYVSRILNPTAKDSDILMSDELPKISADEIKGLAQEFLKQAGEKAFDRRHPEIYKRWFAVTAEGGKAKIPERSGYLLGWKVVEHLAKNNSVGAMVAWDIDRVHSEVLKALSEISGR